MKDFTLHVVCPNPALDHLQVVEQFTPYEVNRVAEVTSLPGGKGLIVARVARRAGASVAVYGFVGGPTGEIIREGTVALGAADRHVTVGGSTRIAELVHAADAAVVPIVDLQVRRPTLDDVFLNLTGRSLREADASTQEDAA